MKTKQASSESSASCSASTAVHINCVNADIAGLDYDKNSETVYITYDNGYVKPANVACDSCIAIMADVYKAMI